ncbi:hypothetical protein LCGC14_0745080 [marine sediment metagenome]|uniref:PPC domain-containing protein n=1 Tax=marine sediment metagenome TaxID=412755 RepID=A0A0F9Q9W8_9ZZZZ
MKSIETNNTRIIVGKIEPDEDLIDSIHNIVKLHDIKSGFINCIGALKQFTIGYYDIESKKYKTETFDENVELISCVGNVTYSDGEPLIHIHISVGRSNYNVLGGHLGKPSIVSITGEVSIFEIDQKLNREVDQKFNLSLLTI